jgi:hypothetical protein
MHRLYNFIVRFVSLFHNLVHTSYNIYCDAELHSAIFLLKSFLTYLALLKVQLEKDTH